jgi:hypothetical protein
MISRARQLRDMASECRFIAELAKAPEVWAQLLDIADSFEHLARCHESVGMTAADSHRARRAGIIEEVSEPTHQSLRDLYTYWLGKRSSRIGPPRSAIQLEEVPHVLPNISLVDVVGDPPRFFFRLCGTGVAEAYGENLTGKYLEEIDVESVSLNTDFRNFYTKLVRECRPQVFRIRFTKRDGRCLEYERIGLPLSEDGKTVNMLLFAYAFDKVFQTVC